MRSKNYKYAVYYDNGPYEILCDLKKDPTEFTNLADDPKYAAVKTQMAARLKRYLDEYPVRPKPAAAK